MVETAQRKSQTTALSRPTFLATISAALGLGIPPPTPDWGADLNLAREHIETRPYLAVFPGQAISFAVLAFT